jgi:putative component of membrane protein insertase Oxa1/YidC/SpoIIIJ protein YidD
MRRLLLWAIHFYKRFISPHKGFGCAYRVQTGRASCSTLGYRAIRHHGVLPGLSVLRRRTYLCGVAHRRHAPYRRPLAAQRGDCDPGCDLPCGHDCHLPGADALSDLADCCDCDWPKRKDKRRREKERSVYIPPRVTRPPRSASATGPRPRDQQREGP